MLGKNDDSRISWEEVFSKMHIFSDEPSKKEEKILKELDIKEYSQKSIKYSEELSKNILSSFDDLTKISSVITSKDEFELIEKRLQITRFYQKCLKEILSNGEFLGEEYNSKITCLLVMLTETETKKDYEFAKMLLNSRTEQLDVRINKKVEKLEKDLKKLLIIKQGLSTEIKKNSKKEK